MDRGTDVAFLYLGRHAAGARRFFADETLKTTEETKIHISGLVSAMMVLERR